MGPAWTAEVPEEVPLRPVEVAEAPRWPNGSSFAASARGSNSKTTLWVTINSRTDFQRVSEIFRDPAGTHS